MNFATRIQLEVKAEAKAEATAEARAEAKADTKAEAKAAEQAETIVEAKADAKAGANAEDKGGNGIHIKFVLRNDVRHSFLITFTESMTICRLGKKMLYHRKTTLHRKMPPS